MATNSQIKWKKGDYITLGKAVANFNRIRNKLYSEENKLYLPDIKNYQEIKENIKTRNELNRVIKSLKKFNINSAEMVTTKGGQELTKWEFAELKAQRTIAKRRANLRMKQLNLPNNQGFSRVQMGSFEARTIEAQIRNFDKLETSIGYDFKRIKERIENQGTLDYQMRKAIIYKENYIKEMEKYSHFDNYNLLINKLNSIDNPIKFYEYVSKDEITVDLTYQSDQYYSQQAFNSFLERLGIEIEEDSETIDEFKPRYKYTLMSTTGIEVAHSNNKQTLINMMMNSKDRTIANGWIRQNY